MSLPELTEIVEPTAAQVEAARQSRERMAAILERLDSRCSPDVVRLPALELPVSAVRALTKILGALAEGHAVTLHALGGNGEVTTSQAAGVLGMSRPTLVGLLDRSEISYRRVGTHRRLRLSEVLAYRERMMQGGTQPARPPREERLRGLREMAEYTNRLGFEY